MLKSFRVKNFKSIQDSGEIDLRPITLFIGANSSGKSSLLQVLLMLKQTLESRDKESPLITNGDYVKLGSYSDFIYGHEIERDLDISFTSILGGKLYRAYVERLNFTVTFDKPTKQIRLRKYTYTDENGKDIIASLDESAEGEPKVYSETHPVLNDNIGAIERVNFIYRVVIPPKADIRDFPPVDGLLVAHIAFMNTFYLRPLRSAAQRDYKVTGETAGDVGLSGEKTVQVLFQDKSQTEQRRKGLLAKVELWLKTFGFGHEP
ncbi:MAG: AAA family ATPase, partial [Rhizobacter sp.]|nr:AAA family ATPase [Chlorobiales bacterium]